MTDWTAGYVADIAYTYGYYSELNPQKIRLAFLQQGLVCPQVGAACELGFGQGLSTNIHAAGSVVEWHGTDFNPVQAGFAQELAANSANGAKLYDEAFDEFAKRTDLPDFDYIGLHGIWSWISDENRKVIVEFIRKKLKVGGVLYISYNTLPGWASFAPMRQLMTAHAELMGAEGSGIVSRIENAIGFAEKMLETNTVYGRANPQASDRLSKMKAQNRHYLAHEYFNKDWHPMYFATMGKWLEQAKVQYACSANLLDAVDSINLTAEQQSFLNEIPDAMFRQSVRDFMVNQQFRKDYWVKGVRKLTDLEKIEAWRKEKIILTTPVADVPLKVNAPLGEAELHPSVYGPLLEVLGDYKIHGLAEIELTLKEKDINFHQIMQAVTILMGLGHVHGVQAEATQAPKTAKNLNAHLMKLARSNAELSYLSSPVTGGGHMVTRFQQLFLLAIKAGKKTQEEWAAYAWEILESQNQKLLKDGAMIESGEENLAELTLQAKTFASKQLPILKALQIA